MTRAHADDAGARGSGSDVTKRRLQRIPASGSDDAGYRYGEFVIRKDQPVDEWDMPSGRPIWYVLTSEQDANGYGAPDAEHDGATLRECKAWIDARS